MGLDFDWLNKSSPDLRLLKSMAADQVGLPYLLQTLAGNVACTYRLPGSQENVAGIEITGIEFDSRRVVPGNCFVAVTGEKTDGHRYIPDAIQRGAAAIVGEQPLENLAIAYIQVEDSRLALAFLSAAFYHFPAHQMVMLGVTGTDGKTTTSTLIYNILQAAGFRTGLISTVSAIIGGQTLDTGFHVTTPEAPEIQKYLAQMLADGHTHVVLEATSHGLAQQRVAACEFDLGVITNVTHEHLDYHRTFEAYRETKGKLFSSLTRTLPKAHGYPPVAILNSDDPSYDYLPGLIETGERQHGRRVRLVSYGIHSQADVTAEEIAYHTGGLAFTAVYQGVRIPVRSRLIGEYNVSNCLAAIATTIGGLNIEAQPVQEGIALLGVLPGRMERVDLGQAFLAYVDFAHTPNALQRSLQAAQEILHQAGTHGRLIAIFGSAGLRDRAKRRMMAAISTRLADLSLFTAEDPRTESLDSILGEMAEGAVVSGGEEGKSFWRIPDRREALRYGVKIARPGDLVIALGKGHEQSMCFGEIEYPWDDRIAMRSALADLLQIPGPEMPYLPKIE